MTVSAATPAGPGLQVRPQLIELADLVMRGSVLVLSGAGMSTESGIPDYRGPNGSLRRNQPMTYQEFTRSAQARQRYWARSFIGWRAMGMARPNQGHLAVAALQHARLLDAVITQNVDGLHQAAGSPDVVELHGGLDRVVCLSCGARSSRVELDRRLQHANPHVRTTLLEMHADGDADVPGELIDSFVVLDCLTCGSGPLKPDVVFFGESVPPGRVRHCHDRVASARAILVLGSSLTVHSGRRFVRQAAQRRLPIAVVNQGPTQADDVATVRVHGRLGHSLPALARFLGLDAALASAR